MMKGGLLHTPPSVVVDYYDVLINIELCVESSERYTLSDKIVKDLRIILLNERNKFNNFKLMYEL